MSSLYVKLDVSYHQDPKLLDLADERAELLFVRALTYCKTHLTDGVIHRRALASFAPFTDEVAPADLAAQLVATGAWQVHPTGWAIPAWLDHNKAADDILTPKKGRELAHIRHHVKKGVVNPECALCVAEKPQVNADACVDGVRGNAEAQCGDALPETETEPKTTPPDSQDYSQPERPESEQPVVVSQQHLRRAIRLVADVQSVHGQNPAGLAATIRRRLDDIADPDRQRIDELLATGITPDDIAAGWVADPLLPPTAHSAEDANDRARRFEAETWARLEEMRTDPVDQLGGLEAVAAMRANRRLRGVS